MPHDTGASVGKLQIIHRGKKCLDFDLDGLCKKLPRSGAQDIGQWIIDLVGLTKRDNVARTYLKIEDQRRSAVKER
ncbi:hypothetical protein ABIA06_005508 [Bradyrhizobium yuanmingense]